MNFCEICGESVAETLTHFLWECSATHSEAVHDSVDGIYDGYMPDVLNVSEAMNQWAFSKHRPRGLIWELIMCLWEEREKKLQNRE